MNPVSIKEDHSAIKTALLENELDMIILLIMKIHNEMDLDEFLSAAISTIKDIVSFDDCFFVFINDNGYSKLHRSIDPYEGTTPGGSKTTRVSFKPEINSKTSNDFASIAARERKEIYLPEINIKEFSHDPSSSGNRTITGLYYIPIVTGKSVIGAMCFHNYELPMSLDEFGKDLLRRVAAVIARGVEHVLYHQEIKRKNEVISRDLELANRIQRNMLTSRLPDIPGVDIATEYIPMLEVGGDYFDFMVHQSGNEYKFGVIITDATGHGVSAACITSMLKISFQNKMVYKTAFSPSKVLSIMNRMVLNKIADNFATACYAWFDLQTMKVSLSSAGHNPIYVINRKTGAFNQIRPKGRVLGLFEDIEPEERELAITDGDRFIFYTDGLTEAINERREIFENTLLSITFESCELPAKEFRDRIISEVKKHSLTDTKQSFDDDIALIIIDVSE